MAYGIAGPPRADYTRYFAMDSSDLARTAARRVVADVDHGFPCRASLGDARSGEDSILLNHVSHDVANPYRTAYAIYVREQAARSDQLLPVFIGRTLSLRGFGGDGMRRSSVMETER
ncbi:hypothetical protein GCM10011494_01680 [Novosphingobium endophyticum]|uniref:Uncharacterized protein n=1 Tax=Novosphingobium endophyticum TaxID=1955250 RepID=A0A916TNV3_9SPHN|nr:DUF1203 domain-containing protein [Novosphingobium endophyticum]GGB87011.1 hypothetical protein GCM10011494_01680 [Novosphingobium endophyticum]